MSPQPIDPSVDPLLEASPRRRTATMPHNPRRGDDDDFDALPS